MVLPLTEQVAQPHEGVAPAPTFERPASDATGFDDPYKYAVEGRKLDSDPFPARNKLAARKTLGMPSKQTLAAAGELKSWALEQLRIASCCLHQCSKTLCNLQQ